MTIQGVMVAEGEKVTQDNAIAGLLDNAFLCLFVNNVLVNSDTKLSDLVEASFPNYTRSLISEPASFVDPIIGGVSCWNGFGLFSLAGNTDGQTISGWFIMDNTSSYLLAAGNFTTPIPLLVDTAALLTVVTVNYSAGQINVIAQVAD